jgi:uroporphyrinogen-III synthase
MSGETILVTRPQGDEKTLTDLLHYHGYRVIHEPLTSIYLQHTQRQELAQALHNEPDACIVTSRHGVQALALLSDLRDIFLICVGDATARVATSLGFNRVAVAGGNASKLTDYIIEGYDEESRFLYLSGEHISIDIESALSRAHMRVQRLALYEAVASTQLSDTLVEQLKRNQLDGVTLLSPRTARIFCDLLDKAGISDSVSHLQGFCLSAAIAEPLLPHPWKSIHITAEATLASLLESVDNVFQS